MSSILRPTLTTSIGASLALASILERDSIYDTLFSCLTPRALIRFGRTHALARTAVVDYWGRAFRLRPLLSRFFDNMLAFRTLQARTMAIISGSTALQFFGRTVYPESDLDLFVSLTGARVLGDWLMDTESYRFVPSSRQPPEFEDSLGVIGGIQFDLEDDPLYSATPVRAVFTFVRNAPCNSKDAYPVCTVQLIIPTISPMHCVLNFHSTCVMNIITYRAAYVLYPIPTYEREISLLVTVDLNQPEYVGKYIDRGFTVSDDIRDFKTRATGFHINRTRSTRDALAWVIPLDVAGIFPLPAHRAWFPLPRLPPVGMWKLVPFEQYELTTVETLTC